MNELIIANQNTIAENIKSARKYAGFTQAQLAKMVGECRETVKCWESGTRQIKALQLARLSVALGVTSDYLLGLTPYKVGLSTGQTAALETALSNIITSSEKISAAAAFIKSIS